MPVAINCCVAPLGIDELWGLISMAANTTLVTVRLPDPVMLPMVALMNVFPVPVVAVLPFVPGVLLMVATPPADELQ